MQRYFHGTTRLMRLYLRQNRIFTLVWLLLPGVWVALNILSSLTLFPTTEALEEMAVTLIDPLTVAMHGPLLQVSVAGFVTWRTKVFEVLLCGILGIIHVIRHTRLAEEQGRRELLAANVTGYLAPLAAALLNLLLINIVMTAFALLGMVGLGLPFAGSLAHCLGVFAAGCVFGGLAGLIAQLFVSASTARGVSFGCLGAAFALHIFWNLSGSSNPAGTLNPLEWSRLIRPFARERFDILLIPLILGSAIVMLALLLMARRDLNAGLFPQKKGRAFAKPGFLSLRALAWRTQKGLFFSWAIAYAVFSFALGCASYLMVDAVSSAEALADLIARLGGVDRAFMSLMLYILALVLCVYTLMAAGILRREELAKGELLLSLPVRRDGFLASHLAYVFGGPAVILLISGLCVGGGAVVGVGEPALFARYFLEMLAKIPAVWVLGGVAVLLFGALPRWMNGVSYGILVLLILVEILWEQRTISDALYMISPFSWVNPWKLLRPLGLVLLASVSALLAFAGIQLFKRRDAVLK